MDKIKPIGTALAAFGLSGRVFHAPFLRNLPQFSVRSVLERRDERSRNAFPEAKIVRSFAALLENPDVELVVINTPDRFHAEMCGTALEAGKHVVVEKPFVPTPRQAKELVALAESKGLLLTVYQNRRFDGDFLALRELFRRGILGRVLEFESSYELWRPVDPLAWREQPSAAGGILTNLGSHQIDQAVALFGRPAWVDARLEILRAGSSVNDRMRVELGYPESCVVLNASYQARSPGPRFHVRGSHAEWIKWGSDPQEMIIKQLQAVGTRNERSFRPSVERAYILDDATTTSPGRPVAVPKGDYGQFYEMVYSAIRNGGTPPVTPEQMILDVEIIALAQKSNSDGRRIPLPNAGS